MPYVPDWWLPYAQETLQPAIEPMADTPPDPAYRPAWWLRPPPRQEPAGDEEVAVRAEPGPETTPESATPCDWPECVAAWIAFFRSMDAAYGRAAAAEGVPYVPFTDDELLAAARLASAMGLAPDASAARFPHWPDLLPEHERRTALAGIA